MLQLVQSGILIKYSQLKIIEHHAGEWYHFAEADRAILPAEQRNETL